MDRSLRLWETSGGQCLRTFEGHADAVTSVALSADGRCALSGSADRNLKVWYLDWELEANHPADWDEGARPFLETFLTLHTPLAGQAAQDRKRSVKNLVQLPLSILFKPSPAEDGAPAALLRQGTPSWTEEDLAELLFTLGCAGYGWLHPEGVRQRLVQTARQWKATPPLRTV
jgi:hypothetical protein